MKKTITPFVLGLIAKDRKYLLTKRKEIDREDPSDFVGKWQIPGGGIDYGETVEISLKRELKEEIRIEVEIIKLIPLIINSIRKNWHGIGMAYLCKLKDPSQKINLNGESSEFGWFTFEEAMNLDVLPGVKEVIRVTEKRDF